MPKDLAEPEAEFSPTQARIADDDVTPHSMSVFQALMRSQGESKEGKDPDVADEQLETPNRVMTTWNVQPECASTPSQGLKMTFVSGSTRGLCDNVPRPSRPRSGDDWLPNEEDLVTPLHRKLVCGPVSFAVPAKAMVPKPALTEEQQSSAANFAVPAKAMPPEPALDEGRELRQVPENQTGNMCRRSKAKRGRSKLWCHLFIDSQMQALGFNFNKKVIGPNGNNTKHIFEMTDAKIRLRGRGSGHEEKGQKGLPAARVHLMLAVATDVGNEKKFATAVQMSAQLLSTVSEQYLEFCTQFQVSAPLTPLFWIGEISQEGRACLGIEPAASSVKLGTLSLAVATGISKENRRGGFRQSPAPG